MKCCLSGAQGTQNGQVAVSPPIKWNYSWFHGWKHSRLGTEIFQISIDQGGRNRKQKYSEWVMSCNSKRSHSLLLWYHVLWLRKAQHWILTGLLFRAYTESFKIELYEIRRGLQVGTITESSVDHSTFV